jgi:site-specific DNA-adenine methylase
MIARTRANIAAAQKPFVLNPLIKLSTRSTISTLIIKDTSPSVIQFSGAVRSFKQETNSRIYETENNGYDESCDKTVNLHTRDDDNQLKQKQPLQRAEGI